MQDAKLMLMGHPAYTPTKPPSCRPGALTRRPGLVHNENCWVQPEHPEPAIIPCGVRKRPFARSAQLRLLGSGNIVFSFTWECWASQIEIVGHSGRAQSTNRPHPALVPHCRPVPHRGKTRHTEPRCL